MNKNGIEEKNRALKKVLDGGPLSLDVTPEEHKLADEFLKEIRTLLYSVDDELAGYVLQMAMRRYIYANDKKDFDRGFEAMKDYINKVMVDAYKPVTVKIDDSK